MVYLALKDRLFIEADENNGNSDDAVLVIDEENKKMVLKFSENCGFVLRRTAERQARGIQKSGFLTSDNQRVGADFTLDIEGQNGVPDRLTHSPRKVY